MSKLLFFLLLIPLSANAFFYDEPDKNLHFGVSAGSTYLLTSGLMLSADMSSRKAALVSAGLVVLAGLVKESIIDDKFDRDDMEANILGAGFGSIPFIVIDF